MMQSFDLKLLLAMTALSVTPAMAQTDQTSSTADGTSTEVADLIDADAADTNDSDDDRSNQYSIEDEPEC